MSREEGPRALRDRTRSFCALRRHLHPLWVFGRWQGMVVAEQFVCSIDEVNLHDKREHGNAELAENLSK